MPRKAIEMIAKVQMEGRGGRRKWVKSLQVPVVTRLGGQKDTEVEPGSDMLEVGGFGCGGSMG